ncbi:MAG: hypothetical protein M0R80_29535 [Proteobacteria bacterium]|jgi:hypothetical protein|nr:hypothetical protein [Pseudomonadota bacterium]
MAIYTEILQGGTNSHGVTVEDFNAFATDFLENGVVGAITNTAGVSPATGAFALNEQGTPDMTLACTAGIAYVLGTPTSGVSQRLRVNLSANQNVTIASNATGGTRYDWVYISLDAAKMKDPAVGADDVATLVTSRSTSASSDDGTPPTFGYCIAVITVANGASTILNASISDKRQQLIPVADASIKNEKLSTTAGEPGGVWKDWTPTFTNLTVSAGNAVLTYAKYTVIGKTCHFRLKVTCAGANVGTAPVFTLPLQAAATVAVTEVIGGAAFTDAGNATWYGPLQIASSTTAGLVVLNGGGSYTNTVPISALIPFTWGNTDYIVASGTYEAA